MSNDIFFNISGAYIPHCGNVGWDVSMTGRDVFDLRYLASIQNPAFLQISYNGPCQSQANFISY